MTGLEKTKEISSGDLSHKVKELEEIKRKLVEIKPFLREKYKVKEIGIFGSYVKGKQGKRSDIDILVDFEEDAQIGLLSFVALENFLSELLGVKVDLVMKNSLKPNIGKAILKEVIYL
jgi:predicted nucleotidyltransferase